MSSRACVLLLAGIVLGLVSGLTTRGVAQEDQKDWIDAARRGQAATPPVQQIPLPVRKPRVPPPAAAADKDTVETSAPQAVTPPPPERRTAVPASKTGTGDDAKAPPTAPRKSAGVPPPPRKPGDALKAPDDAVPVSERVRASGRDAADPHRELAGVDLKNNPDDWPPPETAAPVLPDAATDEARPDAPEPAARPDAAFATPPAPVRAPVPDKKPSGKTVEKTVTKPAGKPEGQRDAAATGDPGKETKKKQVVKPVTKPARQHDASATSDPRKETKKKPAPGGERATKCAALNLCRDAFAKCKADYIKKHGRWDLDKEPCGDKYAVCVRKNFQSGEMFFTRWFWPYQECP